MSGTMELETAGVGGTQAVAAAVARVLAAGDVVSLSGELGAGKTCFVQGAAAALDVAERVTSPTFLLRRDYEGRLPVSHVDVYRLDALAEVEDLGIGEVDGVLFVEWGDAVRPLLPSDHLEVSLAVPDPAAPVVEGDEPRRLTLRAHGAMWRRRLGELTEDLAPWQVEGAR